MSHFGGYVTFRYGLSRRAEPATPAPVLSTSMRKSVVEGVMKFVRNWNQSPFEMEGATRAAIRAGLCLNGFTWARADHEAALIVAACLSRLGAKRPTWEEGQRYYTAGREFCRWCRTGLEDEDSKFGFCSAEHARFALSHWAFEWRGTDNNLYGSTHWSATMLTLPKRSCEREACGKRFRPTSRVARFCSQACAAAREKTCLFDKECVVCERPFVTKSAKAKFCGKRCEHIQYGWRPRFICTEVFDFLVVKPMNARLRRTA